MQSRPEYFPRTKPCIPALLSGANAIWISPIVLNNDVGYHGYHALDIYQTEPHYGSKEDLRTLVVEAHARDIWIMVDVWVMQAAKLHKVVMK